MQRRDQWCRSAGSANSSLARWLTGMTYERVLHRRRRRHHHHHHDDDELSRGHIYSEPAFRTVRLGGSTREHQLASTEITLFLQHIP